MGFREAHDTAAGMAAPLDDDDDGIPELRCHCLQF
jgi:hypothetical protein